MAQFSPRIKSNFFFYPGFRKENRNNKPSNGRKFLFHLQEKEWIKPKKGGKVERSKKEEYSPI